MRRKNRMLTPAEVAELFGVDPKTVIRWANTGKLPCIRTPGGHRRFMASDVRELLEMGTTKRPTNLPVF